MSSLSKTFAVVAALGLAGAPIAAQAGTRAESSPVVVDVQRSSAGTSGESDLARFNLAWLLLLLAAIAALLLLVSDGRTRGG